MEKKTTLIENTKQKIRAGEYGPSGSKFLSIREFCEKEGVAFVTAYRLFHELEEQFFLYRIKNAWYVTFGVSAKNTPLSRFTDRKIVAVHIKEINNAYIASLVANIKLILQKQSYNLIVSTSENDSENEKEILKTFIDLGVSGVINFPSAARPIVDFYVNYPLPMVFVGRQIPDAALPTILTNNFETGKTVAHYLVEQGYRNFYFLGIPYLSDNSNERLLGYREYLQASGVNFSNENVLRADLNRENDFKSVVHTIRESSSKGPTAVFCINDLIAAKLIRYLKKYGVSVPENVGVVGYDDLPVCTESDPTITTIAYNFKEMSEKTILLLEKLIAERKIEKHANSYVFNFLVKRRSTKNLHD